MSTQDAIDPERELLIARLSALIFRALWRGEFEDALRWRAVLSDVRVGKAGEWDYFAETQERAGRAQGRAA